MPTQITEEQQKLHNRLHAEVQERNLLELMFNLYDRWLDEQKHEDFAEYEKIIRERFKPYKVTEVSKDPFSVNFEIDKHEAMIKCTLNEENIDVLFGVYFSEK